MASTNTKTAIYLTVLLYENLSLLLKFKRKSDSGYPVRSCSITIIFLAFPFPMVKGAGYHYSLFKITVGTEILKELKQSVLSLTQINLSNLFLLHYPTKNQI